MLVEPGASLHDAAPLLRAVALLVAVHDLDGARLVLHSIDIDACDDYWQESATAGFSRHSDAAHVGRTKSKRRSFTRRIKVAVGERDGWRCRYCGLRVVDSRVFRALERLLPSEFPPSPSPIIGSAWPVSRLFDAVVDHVEPVSAGGPHTVENMVTACGACNYQAKGDCTLAELGISLQPVRTDAPLWDGLLGVVS